MGFLSLIGRLQLDATQFHATLRNVTTAAGKAGASVGQSFGNGLKSQVAGALGFGAVIQLARSTIEAGDSIDELSERLGVSARKAQEYSLAAKLGGSDTDFFATKFEKLRKALADGKSLAAFGIEAKTAEEAIDKLSEKIATTGLNTEQLTAFVDLFGKGSGRMINILGDLKGANQNAIFMSDKEVENLKKADDILTRISFSAKSAFAWLVGNSAQAIPGTGILLDRAAGFFGKGGEAQKPKLDEEGTIARLEAEQEARETAAQRWMRMQDEILKLEKEIASTEEENRVAGLSREERMNELLAKRAEYQKSILFALTEEEQLKIRLAAAKNEQAIIALGKKDQEKVSRIISSDSLSTVGNFLGQSAGAQAIRESREQTRLLGQIERNTGKQGVGMGVPP